MPFRRKRRMLQMKTFEKHSDTKVHIIGPGTVGVPFQIVRDTEQGARSPDGNTDTIQLGRGNNEECNQGDIVKYINLIIQSSPRSADAVKGGWIEWAFCIMKNSDTAPTKTNLGTNTLGDVMIKYLRNQCIMTGVIPIGQYSSSVVNIQIKIPKQWCVLKTGDEWKVFLNGRTANATATETDTWMVLTSFIYKNYH